MKKRHPRKRACSKSSLICAFLSLNSIILANPQNGVVLQGSVEIESIDACTLEIKASDRAIINWQTFSVDVQELTRFVQPSKDAAVLNRVLSADPSSLMGRLESNGTVYLINPNGLIIGKEAVIDTAGFIASTLDLLDDDFSQCKELLFKGDSKAAIVNLGTIRAWDGNIFLISYKVDDQGKLLSPHGTVGQAAAQEVLLRLDSDEKILIRPQEKLAQEEGNGIDSSGFIEAMQAELKADGNLYGLAINYHGKADALGSYRQNGRIILQADQGKVLVAEGALSARNEEGFGGEIKVLGELIGLSKDALVDVSSAHGEGRIFLGGDFGGANPLVPNALQTVICEGARIAADATEEGNGGKISIYSEAFTGLYGTISARGGEEGGDGGFVEVSGKESLDLVGLSDLRAPKGQTGTLLIDPTDINISAAVNSNVSIVAGPPVVYSSIAGFPPGNVNVLALTAQLGLANVIVQSVGGAGAQPGNASLLVPLIYNSPNSLTLTTINTTIGNVIISAPLTNSGTGSVTFNSINNINITQPVTAAAINLSAANNITITDAQVSATSGNLIANAATGTFTVQSNALNAGASASGNVNITTGLDFDVFAGTGSAQVRSTGTGTAVTGTVGRDLNVIASPSNHAQIGDSGSVHFDINFPTIGRNVLVEGSLASTTGGSYALIGHGGIGTTGDVSGNITFSNVSKNFIIFGGLGVPGVNFAQVGHAGNTTTTTITGDINIPLITGFLEVFGGAEASSPGILGHGNRATNATTRSFNGSISVFANGMSTSGESIDVLGGSMGDAVIGFDPKASGPFATVTVNSNQLVVSGTNGISLQAISSGDAIIGCFNNGSTSITNNGITNQIVQTPQTLGINATNAGNAVVGTFDATTGTLTTNLNIVANAINLNAAANANTGAARILNNRPNVSASPSVMIAAGSLNLFGGLSTGFADLYSSGTLTLNLLGDLNLNNSLGLQGGKAAIVASGDIDINTLAASNTNLTMFGGSNALAIGEIISLNGSVFIGDFGINGVNNVTIGRSDMSGSSGILAQGIGNIDLFGAGNLSMTGGSGPAATSFINATGVPGPNEGRLQLIMQGGINMLAGIGVGSNAFIQGLGAPTIVQAAQSITMTGTGSSLAQIAHNSPTAIFGLSITAGVDLIMGMGSSIFDQGTATFITVGRDAMLSSNASMSTIGGGILFKAGRNISLLQTSAISTSGGIIDIVVDNDFPTPPGFGPGAFTKALNATITNGSRLQIFSSRQPLNNIQGNLNGSPFVQGTQFVNTAQEQWGTYFPSNFGGTPFTIFYKNTATSPIPPPVAQRVRTIHGTEINNFQIAASEFLKDLSTFDDFLFRVKCETLDYRCLAALNACEDFPATIADLMNEETFKVLCPHYEDYHTKPFDFLD